MPAWAGIGMPRCGGGRFLPALTDGNIAQASYTASLIRSSMTPSLTSRVFVSQGDCQPGLSA